VSLNELDALWSAKKDRRGEAAVVLAGLVTGVRRRGDSMAFVRIEDGRGQLEVAFFRDACTEFGHLLTRDRILLVEGNLGEDQYTGGFVLRARQCWDFRQLCSEHARCLALTVDLRAQGAWERLQKALADYRPGATPLRLDLLTPKARGTLNVNGSQGVRTDPELISQLRALPGVSRVTLALHRPWAQGGRPWPGRGKPDRIPGPSFCSNPRPATQDAMNPNFLDFEQPIAELDAKIQELRRASAGPEVNIEAELEGLQEKLRARTAEIFRNLTPWQISQLARHPQRPYTNDYIKLMFEEFHELAGDRAFADDAAIVGGLARMDGQPVMVIGHQKGRDTKAKIRRNFGMPRPEGYRKALRLMKMAERFQLPLLTFIDTPGAYPGIGAEERGQSEAIARNLLEMAELRIPVICSVIGEGGSGGALAIGVGDRTLMLEYSTYSVISPEGCASILWKSADKARDAAEALGLTAKRLLEHKLIDRIVPEPLGGAHRDPQTMAATLKAAIKEELGKLEAIPTQELLEQRYARLRSYGAYEAA